MKKLLGRSIAAASLLAFIIAIALLVFPHDSRIAMMKLELWQSAARLHAISHPDEEENAVLILLAQDNQTAADRIEKLGKIIQALPMGNIILLAPSAMRVGERRNVEAMVGLNARMEAFRKQLDSRMQTFEGSLRISAEMAATLNGPGFKIEAVTPEQQSIAEGFPTVWSWNIEANKEGEQDLEATLYALVSDTGSSARQRVDSYVQKISVTVREQTWREWLQSLAHEVDTAKAIWGTLITAATVVLGWFGISLGRQKGKNAKSGQRRKSPR